MAPGVEPCTLRGSVQVEHREVVRVAVAVGIDVRVVVVQAEEDSRGTARLAQRDERAARRVRPALVLHRATTAASANIANRREARLVVRSAAFISDLLATSCRITRCSGERPQGRASFHTRSRTTRRRGKAFLRKRRPLRGTGSSPFVPSHADYPAFIAVNHGTSPPSTHAVPLERRNRAAASLSASAQLKFGSFNAATIIFRAVTANSCDGG